MNKNSYYSRKLYISDNFDLLINNIHLVITKLEETKKLAILMSPFLPKKQFKLDKYDKYPHTD